MKKLITVTAAMSTCSFAAATYGDSGNDSVEIIGCDTRSIYVGVSNSSDNGAAVFSVDITWGNMKFKYSPPGTWNPETHQYEASAGAQGIFKPENPINSLNNSYRGKMDRGTEVYTIEAGELNKADDACWVEAIIELGCYSETPPELTTEYVKAATLIVKIVDTPAETP